MIINKALVHKGSTLLVQMFFSDVSKIIMFQSLNTVTEKSNGECFKIAGNNSSHKSKTKHGWRVFYLFQYFYVTSRSGSFSCSVHHLPPLASPVPFISTHPSLIQRSSCKCPSSRVFNYTLIEIQIFEGNSHT